MFYFVFLLVAKNPLESCFVIYIIHSYHTLYTYYTNCCRKVLINTCKTIYIINNILLDTFRNVSLVNSADNFYPVNFFNLLRNRVTPLFN